MSTCSIDAIKKQRLENNKVLFKSNLKDVTMSSLGEGKYKLTPKYSKVDVYARVAEARSAMLNEILKEISKDPDMMNPLFANGWSKTTTSAYNHMTIEFTIPQLWENAMLVKLNQRTLAEIQNVSREEFFQGDLALMEQDAKDELTEQERLEILSGNWGYDPNTDTKKEISDKQLYQIMNRNNKC